jgi:hypothetical protein
MEIVMFRKTLVAALTVAIVAGSAITAPTSASAKGGRGGFGLAAAVVGGIATAVIASAVANGQEEAGYRGRGYGNSDCFEKQITKWDRYTGEQVVIGYKTICR